MKDYTVIGKKIPIQDAVLKVTGQFKFTDDLKLPGMLYAQVLFSPVPHARIKSIDTSAAEALPGVRAVATYKNSPRVRYNSTTRLYTQKWIENECIFDDTVRFVGDRVAAVAADSLEIAKKAVRLIKVEYEELPHYVDPLEAMADDAYPIHGNSNIAGKIYQNAGDVEKGFTEADYVFEDTYTTPAVHHGAIETHTAIAHFNARGKLTVISANQNTFGTRVILSRIFGLPLSRIRVINPGMGGAFGGKLEVTVEPIVAELARQTGRPVKLTYNRKESMLSTRTRHAAVITVKTGVKKDGTIVAQDFKVITNTGAYAGSAMNVVGAMSNKIYKTYKIPNMRFTGYPVYTNTPCAGAMRGYGSPQVFFAQQCQLQKIAKALNMDFAELQFKNMVDPDGVDQRTGKPIGNPRPKDCLMRALELQKNWEPLSDEGGKYSIGVGMALGCHGSSTFDAHLDQACIMIKMNEDSSCIMFTGTHEMGQSAITAQMQVVSEILKLPLEMIDVVYSDTDLCGWTVGDFSSRGIYVTLYAAKKAAEAAKAAFLKVAAIMLEEDESNLELSESHVYSKVTDKRVERYRVMDYAQQVLNEDIICSANHHATMTPGSYGVHIARVRIENSTGKVEVTDYIAVQDVGTVINRLGAEGQIEGSVHMGIGYALCEKLEFDAMGKAKTNSFRNYKMLRASEMPKLQMDFIEEYEPTGPFGAKSIAECAIVACAPAIINAICNTLDIEIKDIPYKGK
ncbi:MAG TPA: molybdopterin-dependent oxidoreductase [Firmicutes bacterium]|jgi:CO/xanthine dehydrogenase Mo-binding subunit|nr:molybdopterin-dependent oxidoreductase [Bacillota bacterium]